MRRCSETPRQDAVGERFAAGLDRATKIGEGNMSFKRSVLITAIIAVTTACTTTGDKKNDVADGAVTVTADAKEAPPVANSSPAVPPAMVASNADGIVDHSAHETSAPVAESVAQPTDPAPQKVEAAPQQETVAPPVSQPAPVQAPAVVETPAPRVTAPAPAKKPTTVVVDRTPHTFNVTVQTKDPSHPNFGRGANLGFVVDGAPGKELALARGVTYTFAVRTGIQHDFYFTTSPVGHGAGTVTDGVIGQFIYNGDAEFTPTPTTPPVVYYECRNHKYMGGKIHIANAGEKVVLGGASETAEQATSAVTRNYTAEQVKQKLSFADMMTASSAAAKRVAASANAEAKQYAAEAKHQLASARTALGAGDNNGAMAAVDEALRLMNSATALVPDESAAADDKARYTELLDQVHGFEASYQRNVQQGVKPKGGAELDKSKFNRMKDEAEALADKGQYGEAVKQLEAANELLTTALSAMLDSQTVVYEKNFATPKDEYEYELSRYGSYAELVPVAIEQRHPAPQTISMMDELTKRAQEIHDEAVGLAKKSDYKMAIMALQAATERVQKALRLAGVQ